VSNMLSALSEPFDPSVEKQLKKGGASLTYIPVSEVITRLNRVLGVDMWSYQIVSCARDTLDPDYVVAHVRLTATFVPTDNAPALTVVKDGIGGQKIKRTKNGDIVDLGDEMKGAVSDALKKAAQHFGVGLYLARSEESMSLEYAQEVAAEQPISPEHFEKLREVLNSQSQSVTDACRAHWSEISNNAEFANENITRDLLKTMLDFVKSMNAESSEAQAEAETDAG
jgi:recombination DNA repair RAD52 pathway protein